MPGLRFRAEKGLGGVGVKNLRVLRVPGLSSVGFRRFGGSGAHGVEGLSVLRFRVLEPRG